MPFASTDAQDAALDALWGDGAGAGMPTSFEVGLLTAPPSEGGVELDEPGYARVTVDNDSTFWPDAVDGVKTSASVELPDASGPWGDAGACWGIWVAGDLFDFGTLSDEGVVVGVAGPVPSFTLAVYFNELA